MTQETKPLCYAPFIGMYATGYGEYAPCCVSKKEKYGTLTPENFWVSEEMKTIRTQMLNHTWPDKCSYCMNKTLNNLPNDIWIWEKHYDKVSVTIDIERGNETGGPLFLDYRPSNYCNLKCRMCVPNSSSQIELEFIENKEMQKWFTARKREVINFESFKEFANSIKLEQIKILGGEPTLDPMVLEFLENIYQNYKKLPSLRITTNGTNLNQRFKKIMEKFTDIHLVFSIDAVGETYDYVRTNASWNKTKKTIEKIFENNMASYYGFNVVLMPYNLFNLIDLLEWFKSLKKLNYNFSVFFDSSDIDYTGLSSVLVEDKEQVISEINTWKNKNSDMVHEATDILSLLNQIEFNSDAHLKFISYNNSLDTIRKTNLLKLDERLKNYV
jgi:molybdenum cofactor biosynthesis enzyme MoaA